MIAKRIRSAVCSLGALAFTKAQAMLTDPVSMLFLLSGYIVLEIGVFNTPVFADSSTGSSSSITVDTTPIEEAICWLLYFQQGSFGALLTAAAGLSAMVGAAVGAYKTAINCLIVALGCMLIRPIAILMFDYTMPDCANSKYNDGNGIKVPNWDPS